MSENSGVQQQSAGSRLRRQALGGEPDWSTMTAEELAAYREAEKPQAGIA
ncbi:hypothetical protein GCM10020000_79600 [Streptomyces olivoverticillatus]